MVTSQAGYDQKRAGDQEKCARQWRNQPIVTALTQIDLTIAHNSAPNADRKYIAMHIAMSASKTNQAAAAAAAPKRLPTMSATPAMLILFGVRCLGESLIFRKLSSKSRRYPLFEIRLRRIPFGRETAPNMAGRARQCSTGDGAVFGFASKKPHVVAPQPGGAPKPSHKPVSQERLEHQRTDQSCLPERPVNGTHRPGVEA